MNTSQEQAPDGGQAPTLWTPSTIGSAKQRTALAIAHLVKEMGIGLGPSTQLLPRSDCESVIAEIDSRGTQLTPEREAALAAKTMAGMYPARHVLDPETYSKAITTIFMHYEADFVRRVIDPVNGLPGSNKFLPAPAEVKEALEAEKQRRFGIRATAAWMLQEHAKRQAEAEERARWAQLSPEEMERRRAQVAALIPRNLGGGS